MSRIKLFQQVGVTEDGRRVLGGLFKAHDAMGFPLGMQLMAIERAGCVPDLYGFARDALVAGWAANTIMSVVRDAVQDNDMEWDGVRTRLAHAVQQHAGRHGQAAGGAS